MRIYSELSPTSSADRTLIEQQLRELCAWYEWSAEPQNINAAAVLQDAADAVANGAISRPAAQAIVDAWQPFAGVETQAGNPPKPLAVADDEAEVRQGIVAHMSRTVAKETRPAKRVWLARLLDEQIRNFEGGKHDGHRQRVG